MEDKIEYSLAIKLDVLSIRVDYIEIISFTKTKRKTLENRKRQFFQTSEISKIYLSNRIINARKIYFIEYFQKI